MDRALDDVVRERSHDKRSSSSNGRRPHRNPRGGVRKTGRRDNTYNDSLAWVHDKYDGDLGLATNEPLRRAGGSNMRHNSDTEIPAGAGKLKVENIHYELGEEELLGLFERQGIVLKLELKYDRAGRSEGIAFVTYEREADAKRAIAEFDGANANGQPIRLTLVNRHHQNEGKSLFDRIRAPDSSSPSAALSNNNVSAPRTRRFTDSPERDSRRDPTRRPTPPNIDRYVPPERRRERPRSSEPAVGGSNTRRRGAHSGGGGGSGGREDRSYNNNRRYGNGQSLVFGRLGGGGGGSGAGGGGAGNRSRKTVEELDEEMNNYFTDAGVQQQQQQQQQQQVGNALAQPVDEDEEMIL
ncbi:RNA-binding domain-containing protein [Choiromyces venosus 120613-1]|uniref:RNA-binding domain-containing protein n=1 Tax=Choiromyces venosus 120613-1 TaxID=1336337 RepID=A0A3N4K3V1_9PEZI|nr:RNA-binding domain-containing protein [Choiromyces venosus 120613-1]